MDIPRWEAVKSGPISALRVFAVTGFSCLLLTIPAGPFGDSRVRHSIQTEGASGIGWALRLEAGSADESAGSLAVWTPGPDEAASGSLMDLRVRAAADEAGLARMPFRSYRAAGGRGFEATLGQWSFPEEDFAGLVIGRMTALDPGNGTFVWLTTLRNRRRAPLVAEVEMAVRLDRRGANRGMPAAPCLDGGDARASLWSEIEDPSDGRLWSIAWGGAEAPAVPEINPPPDGPIASQIGRTSRCFRISLEPGEAASLLTVANEGLGQAAESNTADLISANPGRLAVELALAGRAPLVNFPPRALSALDGPIVEYLAPGHLSWAKTPVEARIRLHNPELVTADEHYFQFQYYIDMGHWDSLYERRWNGPMVSDYAYSWMPQDWLDENDEFRCFFFTGGPQTSIPPNGVRFAVDRASPQARILSPKAGAGLNSDICPISFEGRDNLYVRWLSLEVDGRTVWEKDTPGQAFLKREHDEGSWDWSLRQEKIGKHALTVRVRDGAGWTDTQTIEVEIQGIAIAAQAEATVLPLPRGRTLLVMIGFQIDNPRGLTAAKYRILRRIGEGEWTSIKDFPNPPLGQTTFAWLDRLPEPASGKVLYKVEALDAQGGLLGASAEMAAI